MPSARLQFASGLIVTLVIALTGCGSSPDTGSAKQADPTAPTAAGLQPGYLAADDTQVVFIRTSGPEDQLNVIVDKSKISDDGWQVEADEFSGTGTVSSAQVVFTFQNLTWSGTVDDESLMLSIPQDDGILAPLTLESATVAEYNKTVEDLKHRVECMNMPMGDSQESLDYYESVCGEQ